MMIKPLLGCYSGYSHCMLNMILADDLFAWQVAVLFSLWTYGRLSGENNGAVAAAQLWERIRSNHYHLPSTSLISPLAPVAFQPTCEMTLFHLSRLISADEILGFHPSCVPKMPVCPLMAFYIGHINLRLSPPEDIALYWPQSFPQPLAGSAIG